MADRKQVVFCTDGIFPHAVGGMQRHSALLIEELAKKGEFDIVVIHPHAKAVFNPSLHIAEIPLAYQTENKNYLLECYRYSGEVLKHIEHYKDAVIYSQGLSVWKGIDKVKSRLIVNPHGLEPFQTISNKEYLKTMPMRIVFRYIYKKAAAIISLGGKLTTILARESGDKNKIAVIPNAVSPGSISERNFDKTTFQMLFVGRFAGNKGIHILMQAIEQLNREGYAEGYHYHLVGKGPLYDQYTDRYKLPNITFHGFADDDQLKKMYADFDAFVFPTLYEGMPTVVLEAMTAGMPVIVSDTGATAELVDHSNGFLIEKNNVRALKSALQSFYRMLPEEKKQLSQSSYNKVVSQFTWKQVAAKHAELFNTFISS